MRSLTDDERRVKREVLTFIGLGRHSLARAPPQPLAVQAGQRSRGSATPAERRRPPRPVAGEEDVEDAEHFGDAAATTPDPTRRRVTLTRKKSRSGGGSRRPSSRPSARARFPFIVTSAALMDTQLEELKGIVRAAGSRSTRHLVAEFNARFRFRDDRLRLAAADAAADGDVCRFDHAAVVEWMQGKPDDFAVEGGADGDHSVGVVDAGSESESESESESSG